MFFKPGPRQADAWLTCKSLCWPGTGAQEFIREHEKAMEHNDKVLAQQEGEGGEAEAGAGEADGAAAAAGEGSTADAEQAPDTKADADALADEVQVARCTLLAFSRGVPARKSTQAGGTAHAGAASCSCECNLMGKDLGEAPLTEPEK